MELNDERNKDDTSNDDTSNDDNDEVRLIVESQTIICSRKQLMASSDYFKAMFSANMRESDAKEIELKEVAYEALHPLIKHLHGEQLILTPESMCDILSVACMYQFSDAIKTCLRYILRHITASNCFKIKELSHTLQLTQLSDVASKYSLHYFNDVRKQKVFLDFTKEQLVKYLSQEMLNIESENDVLTAVFHWAESTNTVVEDFSTAEDIYDLADRCVQLKDVDVQAMEKAVEDVSDEWKMRFREVIKRLKDEPVKRNNLRKSRSRPQFVVAVAEAETDKEREEPNSIYRFMGKSLLFYDANKLAVRASRRYRRQSENPCTKEMTFDKRMDLPFGEESRNCNGFSLCILEDRDLYASGGEVEFGKNKWQRSMWRYDLFQCDKWEEVALMPSPRRHHGSCCIGSDIYLIGGFGKFREILCSVAKYNTETDEWSKVAPLLDAGFSLSCTAHQGKIYACKDKIQCYSTETDQWSYMTPSEIIRELSVFSWMPLAYGKFVFFFGRMDMNSGYIVEYNTERKEWYPDLMLPFEPESVCRVQEYVIGVGQPFKMNYEKAFAKISLKTMAESQPIDYDKRLKLSDLLTVTIYP